MKIIRKFFTSLFVIAFMVTGITGVMSFSDSVTPEASAQTGNSIVSGKINLDQGVCAGFPFTWAQCTDSSKVIWGWDRNTKITYSWSVVPMSYSQATVQVRGFNSRNKEQWHSAGAGTSGSRTVPWGDAVAYKKIKVKSLAVPLFAPVSY